MKARTEMSPDSISAPHPFHIDRTQIVPHHVGENVLPNFHLFDKLLRFASRRPQPVAIRDDNLGVEKTFLQLLTDVLAIRTTLQAALCPAALHDLSYGQDVFIGLLAPGGYEYTVGFIAILALGAAVVPMCEYRCFEIRRTKFLTLRFSAVALPVEEASYFVLKSRCVAILAESKAIRLGNSLVCHVQQNQGLSIPCVSIAPYLKTSVIPAQCITISSNTMININAAGLVIFTSGTTGPPKGAVQRRGYICAAAEAVAHHYQITSADVVLHVLPVHHATGIGITFLPFLVSGACIDFRSGSFDERWMWERWKRGGLTFFSGVPTIYMRMMRYYMQAIDKLGREKKHEYIAGARQFRALLCGSSALPTPVQNFWTDILGGKRLLTRYGATEFGAVFKVDLEPGVTPEGSVGQIVPGVTVKLSEGNEGMVLVKGPHIFSGYI
jgi:malonyl-CoA/methylmalonyl-CoA synthetase